MRVTQVPRERLSGAGIDLVEISRAARFVRSHRNRLSRFLLPSEYALFLRSRNKVAAFALLFAAKEAASKALHIRISSPSELRQFCVVRRGNSMSVKLGGAAARTCRLTRVRLAAFRLPGAVGVLAFAVPVRYDEAR